MPSWHESARPDPGFARGVAVGVAVCSVFWAGVVAGVLRALRLA
jgi:hypothetical protein